MNFRFYTNEIFPQFMIQLLREKGYNLITSQDAGQANQGISDRAVLAFRHNDHCRACPAHQKRIHLFLL